MAHSHSPWAWWYLTIQWFIFFHDEMHFLSHLSFDSKCVTYVLRTPSILDTLKFSWKSSKSTEQNHKKLQLFDKDIKEWLRDSLLK